MVWAFRRAGGAAFSAGTALNAIRRMLRGIPSRFNLRFTAALRWFLNTNRLNRGLTLVPSLLTLLFSTRAGGWVWNPINHPIDLRDQVVTNPSEVFVGLGLMFGLSAIMFIWRLGYRSGYRSTTRYQNPVYRNRLTKYSYYIKGKKDPLETLWNNRYKPLHVDKAPKYMYTVPCSLFVSVKVIIGFVLIVCIALISTLVLKEVLSVLVIVYTIKHIFRDHLKSLAFAKKFFITEQGREEINVIVDPDWEVVYELLLEVACLALKLVFIAYTIPVTSIHKNWFFPK